jgi:rRNA maturation RNase YbeY
MPVFIINDQKEYFVDCQLLETQFANILFFLECEKSELSILITNDKKIKELNKEYRGKNNTTDVLSFPQNEGEEYGPNHQLMGDVVISTETAKIQSSEHGLSLNEEIVLLLIHGILHLLGFDHESSKEEEYRMKKKTRELFTQIFPDKTPTESCDFYSD